MYPDEVEYYVDQIRKSRTEDQKTRLSEMMLLVDIVASPHTKKGTGIKKVKNRIEDMIRRLDGLADRKNLEQSVSSAMKAFKNLFGKRGENQ